MRAFAVLAVLFSLLAIAWACFTLIDTLALRTYHTTRTFPAVATLDLRTGDADVTIIPDATHQIVVDRTVRRGLVQVADHDAVHGNQLVLGDGCRRPFSWHCEMSITIHTPKQIDVIGTVGDGNVVDHGTNGRVELSAGDGDISLSGVTGQVGIDGGDGDVTMVGLRAPAVSVSIGDGDLTLALANSPKQIRIQAGDGDVDACLPGDTPPYAVTTHNGSGQLRDQIPTSPTAGRGLAVSAGDGDINLHLC